MAETRIRWVLLIESYLCGRGEKNEDKIHTNITDAW